MELNSLLAEMTQRSASDLHLAVGVPPIFREAGTLVAAKLPNLTPEDLDALLQSSLPEERLAAARQGRDFSATLRHGDRAFRCHVFRERGRLAAAVRVLPDRIPTLEELQLPPVFEALTQCRRGLILVVGPTGSGKTTTLVSMLDHINMTRAERILTVEDPINYVLHSKLSLVTQRVVGEDVESYERGLRAVEDADPDIVFIGELRTPGVASLALDLAYNGNLVFSQLTAQTVSEALTQFFSLLPKPRRKARARLAQCLQGVIAQRLLLTEPEYRDKTGRGRVAANEILVATPRVREMVIEGQADMTLVIEASPKNGMQTMDAAILKHYGAGIISRETALLHLMEKERLPEPAPPG